MGGAWRVGGARASVRVQLVQAVGGGGHLALCPVQEALARSARPHHAGGGRGGHYQPAALLPAAGVAVARVLRAFVPAGCRLGRVAGQRGCEGGMRGREERAQTCEAYGEPRVTSP